MNADMLDHFLRDRAPHNRYPPRTLAPSDAPSHIRTVAPRTIAVRGAMRAVNSDLLTYP